MPNMAESVKSDRGTQLGEFPTEPVYPVLIAPDGAWGRTYPVQLLLNLDIAMGIDH